jgi:hypothetical protein
MIRRRTYIAHRRAYWPRLLPMIPISAAIQYLAVGLLGGLSIWGSALSGLVIGVTTVGVRLIVWRRRHPVISPQQQAREWLDAQRRAAPWNGEFVRAVIEVEHAPSDSQPF